MTEQTADDALASILAELHLAISDGRYKFAANTILHSDFLTRRDRDTWKRAIEAAEDKAIAVAKEEAQGVRNANYRNGIRWAGERIADAIASLKDQGHG